MSCNTWRTWRTWSSEMQVNSVRSLAVQKALINVKKSPGNTKFHSLERSEKTEPHVDLRAVCSFQKDPNGCCGPVSSPAGALRRSGIHQPQPYTSSWACEYPIISS